ncbi:hypothetical protein [Nocardia sp. NPDC051832]|uniref:hypothetical protein n=1 Tax=Nocardia sp. NPDC051832 TaxID=3155673 RepID=UPI00343CF2CB
MKATADKPFDPVHELQVMQDLMTHVKVTLCELLETASRLSREIHETQAELQQRRPGNSSASSTSKLAGANNSHRRRNDTAVGPFARPLTQQAAAKLARTVVQRGLSKQPVDLLTQIYVTASNPTLDTTANSIATAVSLPHSTVGRALDAAAKVAGPRAIN